MDLNFVSEIIFNHSESEIKYLKDSIHKVSNEINVLKSKVNDRMERKYVEFVPVIAENEDILLKATELIQDVTQLQSRFNTQTKRDVESLTDELTTLKESLIESTTVLGIISKLCKADEELKKVEEKGRLMDFYSDAKSLKDISDFLNDEKNDIGFLDIYKALTQSVSIEINKHCRKSIDQWQKSIVWSKTMLDLENKKSLTSLIISADKSYLEDLLKTLELYDVSNREIAAFGDNLLKIFLDPIIKKHTVVTVNKCGISSAELTIECSNDVISPPYQHVLKHLTTVFQFLDKVIGIQIHDTTFISRLGSFLDDFLSILIDECLNDAIPIRRDDLKNYSVVVTEIKDFQSVLIATGFISESNRVLEGFFGNVENLFLNKTIENYLSNAIELMKKDLHEIVEVEEMFDSTKKEDKIKLEPVTSTIEIETILLDINDVCPNLFTFPKCCISKSIQDFISLINNILEEGAETDNKSSIELFHLARNIITMYPDIVTMHHETALENIPQISAILYNNLMYLAHKVIISDKKDRLRNSSCFADLVLPLTKEAGQVLSKQIQHQQKILLNTIKESALANLSVYEELPESIVKAIKGCLKQLEHLKNVWENILVANIYNSIVGGLCSGLVDEITSHIVATSDIRADIAVSLVNVLSEIQVAVPRLFSDPNEVYQHVKSWSKLKELIFMLGASLSEVSERWADGKGPLATEFTAVVVRNMIKALFQVSTRRATIISKIK